jgi:hypothetical protein
MLKQPRSEFEQDMPVKRYAQAMLRLVDSMEKNP